jgi:glycosyltransferase involved in cell wall biosynthesis
LENKKIPLVTIRCITYNHAPYIRDAIEGFLMQKTSFPFEILIHDDASTDGTAEIVKEYENKYPTLFKVIYQKENQYSKGNRIGKILSPLTKGKYIAFCEGDDYWTDPQKLEKQVKILEKRIEMDMCCHSAISIDSITGKEDLIGNFGLEDCTITLENIIERRPAVIPTASILIRTAVLNQTSQFHDENPGQTVGDFFIHFFGGLKGGAYYINENMSVYRKLVPGSFTVRFEINNDLRKKHIVSRIKAYEILNARSNGKYRSSFRKSGSYHVMNYLINFNNLRKDRLIIFFRFVNKLGFKQIVISLILLTISYSGYRLVKKIFRRKNLVNLVRA